MAFRVELIRGDGIDTLKIQNTYEKTWVEIRGEPDFEINYVEDELCRAIDSLGKSVNISELVNGESQVINPKSPDGAKALGMVKKYLSE